MINRLKASGAEAVTVCHTLSAIIGSNYNLNHKYEL